MSHPSIIACQECDLLQRKTLLPAGGTAFCRRCGSLLYRSVPGGFDRTLACMLGAAVLFAVANVFPIVSLELEGVRTSTTLFGAARALYGQHMTSVSALVFTTTILMPALEISAMLYMLLPLKLGHVPNDLPAMFRLVRAVRPWGMVDVFMLGTLVSLAKLAHIARVVPGIAIWSFGAVMLLLATAAASFDAQDLWARAAAVARGEPQERVKG